MGNQPLRNRDPHESSRVRILKNSLRTNLRDFLLVPCCEACGGTDVSSAFTELISGGVFGGRCPCFLRRVGDLVRRKILFDLRSFRTAVKTEKAETKKTKHLSREHSKNGELIYLPFSEIWTFPRLSRDLRVEFSSLSFSLSRISLARARERERVLLVPSG